MSDPIALIDKITTDTMYYHQSTNKQKLKYFREAKIWEFNDHTYRKNCKLLPMKEVPTGTRIIDDI